jgi:hypothetical protein
MVIGTTPCSLNDNSLVQFIYARALRSTKVSRAPRLSNNHATAYPIPEDAPVTRQCCPFKAKSFAAD